MKQYENYKDSGVEWLGEIPEHWKLAPIKHLFSFTTGFTPPTNRSDYYDGEIDWVTIADMNEKFISKSKSKITNKAIQELTKEPVPKGSLLYSFKLSVGKVGFAAKELFTNEAIFSIFPKEGLALSYYYYALPEILIHNANENIYGAKLLNQELILNSLMLSLPLIEQKTIAQYLDFTIDKIEQLISEKSTLITKLQEKRKALINEVVTKGLNPNAPMRDSGIEWLGMIPKHWKLSKMKFIGTVKGRIGFKGYSVTDLVDSSTPNRAIVLGGTNVMKSGFISYEKLTFLSYEKYEESPEIMLKGGEILITKVGAGVGENAIYTYYEDKVTINPNVMLLVVDNDSMDEKFVNYFLLSDTIKSQIHIESQKSGAQPAINQSFIKNLPIFVPNKIEQSEIVNFIESRTTKIDSTIGEIQLQLQKLKEYKTAVISEVVTGKVDVREWKPQT